MSLEGQLNQFVMNHFSSMRLLDPESSSKGADVEIHQRYMSPRKGEDNALHPKGAGGQLLTELYSPSCP